ncbi:MAG: galactose-1-phosphate uridylyltransferase [Actinomycetota bacterium]|nr:galactose-1-phosphate uridylyltransferase [Actinomycetota bacterium]
MAELRWNPILKTWTIISSHRQKRPFLEKDSCPFCPGSGMVPDEFDVYAYPNDFPSLMLDPPEPDIEGDDLIPVKEALGHCEVTLYSPKHDITLPELSLAHVNKLVEHWEKRYMEIGSIDGIEYVFIFENRGEAVGVTMIHPHGQIYGYSYIPLKIQFELSNFKEHMEEKGKCLMCHLLEHEHEEEKRIVYESDGFTAFVPPFADYPYQVFVVPERHTGSLSTMSASEKKGLAKAIKCITGGYDDLFGFPFPYMMCMHQVPTDGGNYDYYHFHIEFYPPMRAPDKLKFAASSETGAWAWINDTIPEEKAKELRDRFSKRLSELDAEKQ